MSMSNAIGMTDAANRLIEIKRVQANPLRTLAHELAHAYSIDRLSPEQQQAFARSVERKDFYYDGYPSASAAEIWANSQATCAGHPQQPGRKLVSCTAMKSWLKPATKPTPEPVMAAPKPVAPKPSPKPVAPKPSPKPVTKPVAAPAPVPAPAKKAVVASWHSTSQPARSVSMHAAV